MGCNARKTNNKKQAWRSGTDNVKLNFTLKICHIICTWCSSTDGETKLRFIFFFIFGCIFEITFGVKYNAKSSPIVTRVLTNVENLCSKITYRLFRVHRHINIILYPYPRSCLLYFTLLTTCTSDKYAYFKRF